MKNGWVLLLIVVLGISGLAYWFGFPRSMMGFAVWFLSLSWAASAGYKHVSRWNVVFVSFIAAGFLSIEWLFSSLWNWLTLIFTLGGILGGLFLTYLVVLGAAGLFVHWLGSALGKR